MANNRVILQSGSVAGAILGIYDIFGSNAGSETVTVFEGTTANFQGDFARGGDIIRLTDTATDFTARIVGSNVELFSATAGLTALVPIGVAGTTIAFETGANQYTDSRTLVFDGTNVVLGGQVITSTAVAVNPIAPPQSGQSALLAEPAHDDARALAAPAASEAPTASDIPAASDASEVIAFAAFAAPATATFGGFDGAAMLFSATDASPQFYAKLGIEGGMSNFLANFA